MTLSDTEELEYLALLEREHKEAVSRRWMEGDLTFKLHPVQELIHKTVRSLPLVTPDGDPIRDAVLLCARRFGKSYLNCVMALEDCLKNPGSTVRIVGPEKDQTVDIVEYNMEKIIADAPERLVRQIRSRARWRVGRSQIVIGGFDKKNVKRNLGKEALNIYTEEAGACNSDEYEYAMREILSPQVLHTKGRITHATTPPELPDHKFVTHTMPKAQKVGTYFKFTIYDNPRLDEYQLKQAIADSDGIDTDAFKRNYLCEIIKNPVQMVVPEFDRKVHVKELVLPPHKFWQSCMDVGGVQDKTVTLLYYYDFLRAKLCIVDEREHESGTDTIKIVESAREMEAEHIHEKDKFHSTPDRIADAPGQLQIDLHALHKFTVRPPAKDDFDAGINMLQVAFRQNKIEIHPRCKFLALSLDNGRLNKKRTDFERTPTLGHCDAIAALIYAYRMVNKENPYPIRLPQGDNEWQKPSHRPRPELDDLATKLGFLRRKR